MACHLFSLRFAVPYHEIMKMCKMSVSLGLLELTFDCEVKKLILSRNSQMVFIQDFKVF